MNYLEKLKSPKWQKKRLEVLQRDNFKCCLCGDEETELHVHHLKYTKEPYDAPLSDLETLCKNCHHIKTFHYDVGIFKKGIKIYESLIYILEDGAVALFHNDSGRIEHTVTFKKNSIVLAELYFQSQNN